MENAVYEAISATEMKERRPAPETGTSVPAAVVAEGEVIARWNSRMEEVIRNKQENVFLLLDKQKDDPLLAKIIGLVAENTFSSFYNVFEILREHMGAKRSS